MTFVESSMVAIYKALNRDNTKFHDKIAYVGGPSFGEDPDLSGTAGPAVPQHLPPCIVEPFWIPGYVYSIVPSRNVPLGIGLLAQGCPCIISLLKTDAETTIIRLSKHFIKQVLLHIRCQLEERMNKVCKDPVKQINQLLL